MVLQSLKFFLNPSVLLFVLSGVYCSVAVKISLNFSFVPSCSTRSLNPIDALTLIRALSDTLSIRALKSLKSCPAVSFTAKQLHQEKHFIYSKPQTTGASLHTC
ncbi:uncharacterized protein V6R79_004119 [Siganus canaliculatus]